jgi:hypothetical protein
VDAAFLEQEDVGASVAVLRNDQGLFIAAAAAFIPHVGSVPMAEALALLHGLKLAMNMGFTMVEVDLILWRSFNTARVRKEFEMKQQPFMLK